MNTKSVFYILCSLSGLSCLSLAGNKPDAPPAAPGVQNAATDSAQNATKGPVIPVNSHGAKGDGVTDDTAAVQVAIDAAGTAGGGTVSFPAGTYVVEGLTLKSHTTLEGAAGARLRLKPRASRGIIYAQKQSNLRIRNLIFDPNASGQNNSNVPQTRWTIRLQDCNYCRIEDCKFTTSLENSVDLYLSSHCWVTGCNFGGAVYGSPSETSVADVHATSCSAVTIRDCHMIHTVPSVEARGVVGIFFSGISNGLISGCTMSNCGRGEAQSHQGGAIDLYSIENNNIQIENNTIEHYVYMGIRLRGTDLHVARNHLSANRSFPANANGIEASHSSKAMQRVWITDNDVNCIGGGASGDGIFVSSGGKAGGANFADFHITGNTIRNASRGIHVYRSCIGLDVSHNRISGTSSQGILLQQSANMVMSGVTVTGNQLDMTGNTKTIALHVDVTRDATITNNVILKAKMGIGLKVPSGGLLQGNTVEASGYRFLYYNETRDLVALDNVSKGPGPAEYHQGSDVVRKQQTSRTPPPAPTGRR